MLGKVGCSSRLDTCDMGKYEANEDCRIPWHGPRATTEGSRSVGEEGKGPSIWKRGAAGSQILLTRYHDLSYYYIPIQGWDSRATGYLSIRRGANDHSERISS